MVAHAEASEWVGCYFALSIVKMGLGNTHQWMLNIGEKYWWRAAYLHILKMFLQRLLHTCKGKIVNSLRNDQLLDWQSKRASPEGCMSKASGWDDMRETRASSWSQARSNSWSYTGGSTTKPSWIFYKIPGLSLQNACVMREKKPKNSLKTGQIWN